MKYKWEVAPKPVGRYSSFERRSFPSAYYENNKLAALIRCEDEYHPADVKIGKHKPLTLIFVDYSVIPDKRRKLINTFKTLPEAKAAFERVLIQHPEIQPGNLKQGLPKNITG